MKKLNQAGLTIVELMLAIAIATAIVTVLFSVSLGYFSSAIRSQITAQMAIDSHFMLRAIIEDLRLANNIGTISVLPDANAPGGGWITSDAEDVIIINRPATTQDNDIIYNDETGYPYNNEHIYFLSDQTLFKRLLKNDEAVGNSVSTSCPHTVSDNTCPADRKYSSYVSGMTLTFYNNNNEITTDMATARSVKLGITTARRVFGQTLTFDNSTFTKLRN